MYQYIPREELKSVLDIVDFPESDRAEIAYQHFVHDIGEALYIEEDGVLLGIVSIGDLERHYAESQDKLEINRHFSYTNRIDEEKAAAFFARVITFFEFPVVNDAGRLEGVMTRAIHDEIKAIRYNTRQPQIASLVTARYLKEQWHQRELNRFLTNTKARVVLYYSEMPTILKAIACKKRLGFEKEEEIYWKDLTKSQWDFFLGEQDTVSVLKKEFGNFHTKMIKGVSEIVDMEGEFYRCEGGTRFTEDNPNHPESRVIFYGPCIVVGAYCRDGQTIASCFQRILNAQADSRIQVINRGLFNMTNFFSRVMTDALSEKDIAVLYVEKRWLTEEICRKCVYVGNLTNVFLNMEGLENNILDHQEHCNYKVNGRLAERIYHDLEKHHLLYTEGLSGEAERIQDYYIGSEIMSEVLLYMERNGLLKEEDVGIKGAMTLLADPFTDRHRKAVEVALQKTDVLYLFLSEDSNLGFTLEERLQIAGEALADLGDKVVVVPAGKYLYTKKISRGIRKQRFCDDDMEFDCDLFGEIFGGVMGIRYRFIISELNNPVERKYMDTCLSVLPRSGVTVEELLLS